MKEKEIEKAKEIVKADMENRAKLASEELQKLLEKHNVSLQIGEQGIYIQPNL